MYFQADKDRFLDTGIRKFTTIALLWERACSRWDRRGVSVRPRRPNREQARFHRFTHVLVAGSCSP
ncbi:hypothetical protein C7A07_03475 [Pseudomonas fragi]|nr:hypothetical protein C7A07_03475 [Pseudomonas fragi]